jgi:hypothetical protein
MRQQLTDYSYLAEEALGLSPTILEMERECNQTDHCTVGAALVSAWKFSPAHGEAVHRHHDQTLEQADSPQSKELLALLLLAKRIEVWSHQRAEGLLADPGEAALRGEIAQVLELGPQQIREIISEFILLARAH